MKCHDVLKDASEVFQILEIEFLFLLCRIGSYYCVLTNQRVDNR